LPRFSGENFSQNEKLMERLNRLAAEKRLAAAQLAIAWVLAKGPRIIPVIGARTRAQLSESLGALRVNLTERELARIEESVPAAAIAGTRYDERQMSMLDSERS
jgi:aryl-alcohol dehydrogenase-like predicted oxidoreductase